MGMFDSVICEYPLPGAPDGLRDFQTKDLDCQLDTYTITAEGRLIHHYREWQFSKEIRDWEAGGKVGLQPLPIFETKPGSEKMVDKNHHGYLRFYTTTGSHKTGDVCWHEYVAKFTDGAIVGIERIAANSE